MHIVYCAHGRDEIKCLICTSQRVRLKPQAVGIVALRRIVDRVVSAKLDSDAALDDILRIALKALNNLEDL